MQLSDVRNRVSPHTAEAWQSIKDSWPLNDTVPTLREVYRRILPDPGEARRGLPWLAAFVCGLWRAVVFTTAHLIMQAHNTRLRAGVSLFLSVAVVVVAALAYHPR